jgi:glycosyltransferase involved in cell wall biosynthesis
VSEANDMIPGLVSVVVCAWNNWPDLEMTIESALHQSYRSIEVIVVDNSSTDETANEIPGRFGGRVRYLRQPNKDCAGAYNAGYAVATGEFVQFVDGDDVLAPNKIEKQVEMFRADPKLDIVYGDVRMFQTTAGVATWNDPPTREERDMLHALLRPAPGICALGTLFHRRVMERVGAWDENLYIEDHDYFLRAAWAGCEFGHCSSVPLGFARERIGQKTKNDLAMAAGAVALWEKTLSYVTREPYRRLVAVELARCRLNLALSKNTSSREAIKNLALARAASPELVSLLWYALFRTSIVLPALRSPWLRPIRHCFLAPLRWWRNPLQRAS